MRTPPRCSHCGSAKFGLIRYRAGLRQFCKKKCRDDYRFRLTLRTSETLELVRVPFAAEAS